MSRTCTESVLVAPYAEQGMLHHPRVQGMGPHKAFMTIKAQSSCRSWAASSVQELTGGVGMGNLELQEIMQKSGETPTTTYLGVSPPVRSGCYGGAANPWSHDRSWKNSAYSASHSNLQALRELDSEGESFLKSQSCPSVELVLGASSSMEEDEAPTTASGPQDGQLGKAFTPFACHTAYFQV